MEILRQEISIIKLLILTLRLIKPISNNKLNKEINPASNCFVRKISKQNLLSNIIIMHDPIDILFRFTILCS